MPRPLRIEFPGAIYHVMNRGDRREPIFHDDGDRRCCLDTLAEACAKTAWQVHALCLMPNHFHAVIETPRGNLVAGMKWWLGTYTSRFNRRHKLFGHLFSGRYKALIVNAGSPGYLRTVCDYVHLNPARAKLLTPEQPLSAYAWSSCAQYLQPPSRRWPWLRVDRVLGELRIPKDSAAGRRAFERHLEERRLQERDQADYKPIRRGWFLGDDAFKQELLEAARQPSPEHAGDAAGESAEAHAERVLREELARRNWTVADLEARPKGDPEKVRAARRLRAETTMTLKWIAKKLRMGTWTNVSNCLARTKKSQ
jgi:REP element-mobilizing transposase RayT